MVLWSWRSYRYSQLFWGYSVSAGMMLAPRDYWREPNYSIFKRKLMYGNSVAGTVTAIATFVFYILQEL